MNHQEISDLFKRSLPTLLRTLANKVPRYMVEDIAQETFVRLLRYPDAVIQDDPQHYLLVVARNVALEWYERVENHRRRWLGKDEQFESFADEHFDAVDPPENLLAYREGQRLVAKAMAVLTFAERRAIFYHVNEGLTYQEIAQKFGLTYRQVLRHISKGYSKLRIELETLDREMLSLYAMQYTRGGASNKKSKFRIYGTGPTGVK